MGIFFLIFGMQVAFANDLRLASIYVDAGRLADAVNILKKYEASEEDEPKVNLLTGKIYLAIDKPEKALEFFEMAMQILLSVLSEIRVIRFISMG
jgi:predicted negative regulator of RcsB-dependent stress response